MTLLICELVSDWGVGSDGWEYNCRLKSEKLVFTALLTKLNFAVLQIANHIVPRNKVFAIPIKIYLY